MRALWNTLLHPSPEGSPSVQCRQLPTLPACLRCQAALLLRSVSSEVPPLDMGSLRGVMATADSGWVGRLALCLCSPPPQTTPDCPPKLCPSVPAPDTPPHLQGNLPPLSVRVGRAAGCQPPACHSSVALPKAGWCHWDGQGLEFPVTCVPCDLRQGI